jgi:hypothetical protein
VPNEYSNAPYKLAANKRKDDGNRSRIVIEPAPETKPNSDDARPKQPNWPPKVTDPTSYDKNAINPWSPEYPKKAGSPEPEKTA